MVFASGGRAVASEDLWSELCCFIYGISLMTLIAEVVSVGVDISWRMVVIILLFVVDAIKYYQINQTLMLELQVLFQQLELLIFCGRLVDILLGRIIIIIGLVLCWAPIICLIHRLHTRSLLLIESIHEFYSGYVLEVLGRDKGSALGAQQTSIILGNASTTCSSYYIQNLPIWCYL